VLASEKEKPAIRRCHRARQAAIPEAIMLNSPRSKSAGPVTELLESAEPRLDPAKFVYVRMKAEAPVARLTLQRPEHNLLNEAMLRELAAGVDLLSARDDVKVIVLEAAGRNFCGGIDIGEYTPERAFQLIEAFHKACMAIVDAPRPVIVVVNGPAIGGGAELAAFGDLIVATPRARFALPEITIGMFPPLASTMLPYLIGPKLALELVLTGDAVTAERAQELGLVNRVVPEAQLEAAVGQLVARMTAQSGAVLAMAKKAVLGGVGMSLRDALRFSMDVFLHELYRLEDSQEGLRALIEKRKPEWKNR
jgi:cyclohexa-1,5-dienecarbonyl-CoA hydratase